MEILSPENPPIDVREKVPEYHAIGVRVVLVVDPDAHAITAHRPGGVVDRRAINDTVPLDDVIDGFALPVDAAFE